MLMHGGASELVGGPEVGGKVLVSATNGGNSGLGEVTSSSGLTTGLGVDVLNTGELEDLLGDRGGDNTSTTGSRDEADADGTSLSVYLARDGVRLANLVTPVTTANGDDGELSNKESTLDGVGNFLGALDTKTDVTILVTNNDEGLEASALTGTGLLLDGHDLHNLINELVLEEVVDDLVLLDRKRVKVDLLEVADLTSLDETAKLGNGSPLLSVTLTAGSTTTTTTSSTESTASSSIGASSGGSSISHMLGE